MTAFNPSIFSHLDVEYGDIRILDSEIQLLIVQNGEIHSKLTGYETGAGVRILKEGNWGFSSTTEVSATGLVNVVNSACKTCLSNRSHTRLQQVNPVTHVCKAPTLEADETFGELCKELESAMHYFPLIRQGRVQLRYNNITKHFFNTDGSHIVQNLILLVFDLHATAQTNGKVSESRLSCTFTSIESMEESELIKKAVENAEKAVQGLKAGTAPNGNFPVILGSALASIFVHEAVGHRMEADEIVKPHALMRNKKGVTITHPSFTVVDTMDDGLKWYKFDDEGVSKEETVLIHKGIVEGFLQDRQTAHFLDARPTGNSRASSYTTQPLTRMTNIKALPGNMSCDEMIEECCRGLFLDGFVGGAALADGTFRFAAREGHLIERGELKKLVGECVISGSTLNALSCLSGVGKKVTMHYSECIKKGQGLMVGLGSPELLLSELRVGG